MGTLNQAETRELQGVVDLLEYIEKYGYLPGGQRESDKHLPELLELAKRRVMTMMATKGNYPA